MNPAPAYCNQCQRVTPTIYLPLRNDLIGNVCADCHACRKGKPFISRREYQQYADAHPGQGLSYEQR